MSTDIIREIRNGVNRYVYSDQPNYTIYEKIREKRKTDIQKRKSILFTLGYKYLNRILARSKKNISQEKKMKQFVERLSAG